jgi:hypothetical protein
MGDTGGEHTGFANSSPGEDENRPLQRLDRPQLLFVQTFEITWARAARYVENAWVGRASGSPSFERRINRRVAYL